MNYTRIVSALLGLPIVILILVYGNVYVVDIAFAIIAIMSLHEYFHAFSKKSKPVKWIRIYISKFNCFYSCHSTRVCIKTSWNYSSCYCNNFVFTSNFNKYENKCK